MSASPSHRNTITKLVILASLILLLVGVMYLVLIASSKTLACRENLARIYQSLEMYELAHGSLPRLAFFAEEPRSDSESICVVLESYGLSPETFVCPSAHPLVAKTGLSYIWNTRLNGRSMQDFYEKQWMLVEIEAISLDVNFPHFGACQVLYTDGSIERMRNPAGVLNGWP